MPSVTNNTHEWFEGIVNEKLRSLGYMVESATYHDIFPEDAKDMLSSNYTPASLYIRGRSDRIAIRADRVFEFEVKTHENMRYNDMTLEALPLMHHVQKSWLGVDCLYMFHNPKPPKLWKGFWVSNMPEVRELRVPSNTRYSADAVAIVHAAAPSMFNPHKIITKPIMGDGSHDPFIIVDSEIVKSLRDLKEIVGDIQ